MFSFTQNNIVKKVGAIGTCFWPLWPSPAHNKPLGHQNPAAFLAGRFRSNLALKVTIKENLVRMYKVNMEYDFMKFMACSTVCMVSRNFLRETKVERKTADRGDRHCLFGS